MKVHAIDLFCGAGGLTRGLLDAGVNVVAGIDLDNTCKFSYEINNKVSFIEKDLTHLKGSTLNDMYPSGTLKILVGCAPCQPFSKHTQKDKNRDKKSKWGLLYQFKRLIEEVNPEIVSMENVPDLMRQDIFNEFVDGLEELGYAVQSKNVHCPDYGVPQARNRLVLLASKLGEIKVILPTHQKSEHATVADAIGHLKKIKAGEIDAKDPLHRTASFTPLTLRRIQQSKPSGTWRDWDEDLILKCHKKSTGKSYGSVYGRMSWEKPSPTMTTQFYNYGTGRFGHPEQDRALSLREGAILQTFPETYQFINPDQDVSIGVIGRHIGNAVPVRLGEVIGLSIKKHLKEHGYGEKIKKQV